MYKPHSGKPYYTQNPLIHICTRKQLFQISFVNLWRRGFDSIYFFAEWSFYNGKQEAQSLHRLHCSAVCKPCTDRKLLLSGQDYRGHTRNEPHRCPVHRLRILYSEVEGLRLRLRQEVILSQTPEAWPSYKESDTQKIVIGDFYPQPRFLFLKKEKGRKFFYT